MPKKYFDLFPVETVQLPKVLEGDLDDLGDRAREIASRGGDYHRHVVEAGQWRAAVQGYLASIAYADAMVDHLLRALDSSPYAENTIVVLWSDHGWQLGEKEHWRKFALWDNVARTVLMIRAPRGLPGLAGIAEEGGRCRRVTSLVDLYPTLIELTGLPEKTGLDGRSLVPLLEDPRTEWEFPAITTYDRFEYSIRSERWRYIRYIDDTEELYDHDERSRGMDESRRRIRASPPSRPSSRPTSRRTRRRSPRHPTRWRRTTCHPGRPKKTICGRRRREGEAEDDGEFESRCGGFQANWTPEPPDSLTLYMARSAASKSSDGVRPSPG